MEWNVMTFNLRVDAGTAPEDAWSSRSARVAAVIARHAPHVVGTQEGTRAMLDLLRGQLGDYAYVGEGRSRERADEYCAIWYDTRALEAVESGQFWLSEQPDAPGSVSWGSAYPRICTWARMRATDGSDGQLLVCNTHLDHISQPAREAGACLLWTRLRQLCADTGLPALLTGDFNAEPDNAAIRFLRGEQELQGMRANLRDAYSLTADLPTAAPAPRQGSTAACGAAGYGATFHDFRGGEAGAPIDYIFATPGLSFRGTQVVRERVGGRFPSDHYPVITTVASG
ncbi:endonuclease/exonuclease/phosphatase family protein [Paenibacillus sp. IB182496]|uniref:Endonuclease/exonuclease/phosphatase family protein n=1 Tax=Paenibacillus sabuli TaxID=2772509 RepID=A0A927BVD7_9BACL|nr:endonuclease/exonuclease/phosphatase family protein [Paenibacillus sabuli]MBD2846606.1 endonuclease/exonuclease/phosphatase family protein [Paenibacillus sabuli]